jgi:hypothetical protein
VRAIDTPEVDPLRETMNYQADIIRLIESGEAIECGGG